MSDLQQTASKKPHRRTLPSTPDQPHIVGLNRNSGRARIPILEDRFWLLSSTQRQSVMHTVCCSQLGAQASVQARCVRTSFDVGCRSETGQDIDQLPALLSTCEGTVLRRHHHHRHASYAVESEPLRIQARAMQEDRFGCTCVTTSNATGYVHVLSSSSRQIHSRCTGDGVLSRTARR